MYKVAIIGAGKIASGFDAPDSPDILSHAHACRQSPAFCLAGFYDSDLGRAKEAAKKWSCRAYLALEAALSEAEVVICCVPDVYHGQMLMEISNYQPRLVIAEKPLAVSVAEGEAIRRIYHGRIPLLINYSRRFLPEFHSLREEIRQYGKFLKGVGYYGKGILHNGSHMIDLLGFLFGGVQCLEVFPGEIPDFAGDASKDLALQVQGALFYMLAVDSRAVTVFELELFFEKARVRILDGGTVIEAYETKESAAYQGYYNYALTERRSVNYSQALAGLLDNAQKFLDSGEELMCSLEDGLHVLRLCTQIKEESL
jgi:predicted dehydrogenase